MTIFLLALAALCVALAFLLACPGQARAGYLDPGSGSTLVQGLVAIAAAIRRFFGALFGGKKS